MANVLKRPAARAMRRPAAVVQPRAPSRKSFTIWPAALRNAVRNECVKCREDSLDDDVANGWVRDGRLHCPLCPTKSFKVVKQGTHRRDVQNHILKQHVQQVRGTWCTKVCRIVAARHKHNTIQNATLSLMQQPGRPTDFEHPLADSVAIMKQMLFSSPSWNDKKQELETLSARSLAHHTCILLDMEDTRYILRDDIQPFHQISTDYVATDKHLWGFLAALLHPHTKGAHARVQAHMAARCDWKSELLPKDPAIFKTLCEAILAHPLVIRAMDKCRAEANVSWLGGDGQYSTLMGVLYQTPHGKRKLVNDGPHAPGARVNFTVQGPDAVLLTKPLPSEGPQHVIPAYLEAVGSANTYKVQGVASDKPGDIDVPELYEAFENLMCVGKDGLHVALKVEQASGEHVTEVSALLRRCLVKYRQPTSYRGPYYTKATGGHRASTLPAALAAMTDRECTKTIKIIKERSYPERAYARPQDLVKDIAAILHKYPTVKGRKADKTTVLASLTLATNEEGLGYLMNNSIFAAHHPVATSVYGTTRNEAWHLGLKAFYRNVMYQTGRNAQIVAKVATLMKLVVSKIQRDTPSANLREHELLRVAVATITGSSGSISPALACTTVRNPQVDYSVLSQSAKKLRKRPAAGSSL
jgi:hypothetical protein